MTERRIAMATARAAACALCLMLCAAAASAQEVSTDYDHGADFTKYKTFAWGDNKGAPEGFADRRIKEAIKQQLVARGLREVTDGTPDVRVAYQVGARDRTSATPTDTNWSSERWSDPSNLSVEVFREGRLVVDIVDAARKELIWRGTAVDTISEDTSKNRAKIQKAVEKMFKQYPPKIK
jgi:hypothetical protein